ncbi:hypothetical protein C8P63_10984 [Melghirimyces profundicolus]|uniref:Glyoxalase/bleomycin resistance protein/dioxygenase superfamily protein n=1 Tax=Melghirimyces profundicolus TaxID=1242148 RepID=A0A2T6BW90_9BACL|nr:hypothetical protein C8P63_10984 [Melghirimyces profundicolus]
MELLSIHHAQITVPRGAENEARRFYCGVMGLREIPKPGSLSGRGGFWLRLGDVEIHVGTEDGIDRSRSKALPSGGSVRLAPSSHRSRSRDSGVRTHPGL